MKYARLVLIVVTVNLLLGCAYLYLRTSAQPDFAPINSVKALSANSYEVVIDMVNKVDRSQAISRKLPITGCKEKCENKFILLLYEFEPNALAQTFQLKPNAHTEWALFLPFYNEHVQVFLNTIPISAKRGLDRGKVYRHEPLILNIDSKQLQREKNQLAIVLRGVSSYTHLLSPFYLGPKARLQTPANHAQILGRSGHRAVVMIVLPFLLLAIGLSLRVKPRALYLSYFAGVVGWLATLLPGLLPGLSLSAVTGIFVWMSGALLALCMMPRFADALLASQDRRIARGFIWLLFFGLCFIALLCFVPGLDTSTRNMILSSFIRLVVLLSAPYVIWRFWRYARDYADDPIAPWAVAFLVALCAVGMFDAIRASVLWFGLWEVSLAPFGLLFLTIAFALEVARQVYRNHLRVQNYVRDLEEAVAQSETKIRENYQRIQQIQSQQELAEERRRIMQDMHDGVGGSLSSLLVLARTKKPEVEVLLASIAEGLSDLRLIIEALNSDDDELAISLGRLRARIEPRLREAGIKLEWLIAIDVAPLTFGPRATLQIFRFAQEAVNNAIRHSRAQTIRVSLKTEANNMVLSVEDDGQGFDSRLIQPGLGLAGMQTRANAVRAQFVIAKSKMGGAAIQLHWPSP